jgi:serine/threonine protein kinase
MDSPIRTARELFVAALKRPPDQWDAYLADACGGDEALRRRVRDLLDAHGEAGDFLASPAALSAAAEEDAREGPSTVIGPYKLVGPLGEGGMGTVWLAHQEEPVRRRVALKVIKPGMDTRQVIARFEAERQALALMDHPHIARVLDAGATDAGRPYFVMELVQGAPITGYCDGQRLTPRQRLELFVPVCRALQHAHQKGVIHRDLKPSNVLVASCDGRPAPKVIDFGVAKATGQQLTEQSAHTGFGAVVGTVEYMSPEQASFNQLDVDTRSDIYSLGVLLYELLTGSPPFSRRELEQAGLLEGLRVIREQEPSRPSTRLSTAEGLPALAANRGTEPAKLPKLVRGELDWIVMKALEKDRNRRYDSANDLALDIERYLHDEPVQAGPPGAGYRLRKFVRRHRGPVLAAALVLFALLAGQAGAAWGLVRAEAARAAEAGARQREAERAEAEARQRARAEENERRANRERDRAEEENRIADAVKRFLLIDLLRQADGRTQADTILLAGGGFVIRDNPTVRELLDRAAAELTQDRIEAKFPKQPRLQAEILYTVGRTYLGVGEYEKAIAHLGRAADRMRRTLGPNHPHSLALRQALAVALRLAHKTAEAVALFEEVRGATEDALGPRHPQTLTTLDNLALAYLDAGRAADAIALLEEVHKVKAADLGPDQLPTLETLDNLGAAYRKARRAADAVDVLEKVRRARTAQLGPEHPDTLAALENLGGAYGEAGKAADAVALLEEVRRARENQLGPEHPDTLRTLNNLATAYFRARKFDQAVPLYEEAVRRRKARSGPDHPDTLLVMGNLGMGYREAGRQAEGVAMLEEARARAKKLPGPMPAQLEWLSHALADTYDRAGQFARSEPLYREFVEEARAKYGPDRPPVVTARSRLGLNLVRQGRGTEAEPILSDCLAYCEKQSPTSLRTFEMKALLGGALLDQKKYARAEPLLRAGYQGLKANAARISPEFQARLRDALDWLIALAEAQDDGAAAGKWRKEREAMAP